MHDPISEIDCFHSHIGHSVVGSLVKETIMSVVGKYQRLKYPNLKMIL